MTTLDEAVTSGIKESSTSLTASLRKAAREGGWPAEAIRGLRVNFVDNRMVVDASASAETMEYGTSSTPPNPVIRKWADSDETAKLIMTSIEQNMQGVL